MLRFGASGSRPHVACEIVLGTPPPRYRAINLQAEVNSMNLTSIKAPALAVAERYAPIFTALDVTSTKVVDPFNLAVGFKFGHDEDAFRLFVRDEIQGAKLTLSSEVYNRCMPAPFDAERAVSYLGKAPGVTGVTFVPDMSAPGAAGTLQISTSDETSAAELRNVLRESVVLAGQHATAKINIAPGEG
jgi:hypothetical protein